MTVVAGFDPTEISLSDNAVSKLQHLIEDEDNPSFLDAILLHEIFIEALPIRSY